MTNPRGWHSPMADQGGIRWRWTPLGIEIEGSGVERTAGEPATIRRIWRDLTKIFTHWSAASEIPVEILLATAATETRGDSWKTRFEPDFKSYDTTPDKVSIGLMQTLLSTARAVTGLPLTHRDLCDPNISVRAGALYIKQQAKVTQLDPILVACSYNSGGIYVDHGPANRFKLRCFPIGTGAHLDRFVKWFGDAVAVIAALDPAPACPTWRTALAAYPPVLETVPRSESAA